MEQNQKNFLVNPKFIVFIMIEIHDISPVLEKISCQANIYKVSMFIRFTEYLLYIKQQKNSCGKIRGLKESLWTSWEDRIQEQNGALLIHFAILPVFCHQTPSTQYVLKKLLLQ